ncbi:hypothetical protein IGI04_032092 [Brassica rapa subsp. trilocularis]|uniref:Uncharacterized protein n=1 Tax=Brassica rapa subsp. trilocularis TaxID=1813537 RepID=A0ABQ7LXY6_BRACM|nr:hypothetical protein IGI04_032092 [Brassica rapa subsp. trilocularis]
MHLSLLSIFFSLFIILHYKNTSTLLLHLQNNLLRLLHSYSLSLSDTSTTYPCCIPLSLSPHTHTQTHTHTLLKICRAEDHHVHDSQEAQESLTIRFPILLLSSNISSLSSAAAVLTRCQHLKYYKRLATTSGTYTERLMISVTVCRNSWLQRTTTVPRQPSLGACLIIKILTN